MQEIISYNVQNFYMCCKRNGLQEQLLIIKVRDVVVLHRYVGDTYKNYTCLYLFCSYVLMFSLQKKKKTPVHICNFFFYILSRILTQHFIVCPSWLRCYGIMCIRLVAFGETSSFFCCAVVLLCARDLDFCCVGILFIYK